MLQLQEIPSFNYLGHLRQCYPEILDELPHEWFLWPRIISLARESRIGYENADSGGNHCLDPLETTWRPLEDESLEDLISEIYSRGGTITEIQRLIARIAMDDKKSYSAAGNAIGVTDKTIKRWVEGS